MPFSCNFFRRRYWLELSVGHRPHSQSKNSHPNLIQKTKMDPYPVTGFQQQNYSAYILASSHEQTRDKFTTNLSHVNNFVGLFVTFQHETKWLAYRIEFIINEIRSFLEPIACLSTLHRKLPKLPTRSHSYSIMAVDLLPVDLICHQTSFSFNGYGWIWMRKNKRLLIHSVFDRSYPHGIWILNLMLGNAFWVFKTCLMIMRKCLLWIFLYNFFYFLLPMSSA